MLDCCARKRGFPFGCWLGYLGSGQLTYADQALELFKRQGLVKYDEIRRVTKIKNVPDCILKLRKRGHRIEAGWETKRGRRHVGAYRGYSKAV